MMASRAIQDLQLEKYYLECNNVLPGTATGYNFREATVNCTVQDQEPDNFGKQRLIVPFRISNGLTSGNNG